MRKTETDRMKLQKINRIKKKTIGKQPRSKNGIVCGRENPASLGCEFYELEDGELATVFTAEHIHEGHDNIMHGGLSAAILDEVMGRCNSEYGEDGIRVNSYVTGEMTVRYCLPIAVGKKMYAYGRIDKKEGRKNFSSGEIIDEDGIVYASATGIYIRTNVSDNPESFDTATNANGLVDLSADDPSEL